MLGHLHLSGAQFVARMALPWVVSIVLTAVVIAIAGRRSRRMDSTLAVGSGSGGSEPVDFGLEALAVVAVTVLVLALSSPALPVVGVGIVAVAVRSVAGSPNLDGRRPGHADHNRAPVTRHHGASPVGADSSSGWGP